MNPEQLWRFVGRSDVFAEQSKEGAYFPVRRPLTTEDLAEHLAGFWSVGTYVIDPANGSTVQFVVFDLDDFDPQLLELLIECVEHLVDPLLNEYPMLLLEKSGGKGYHVWLFLEQAVAAHTVRAWLAAEFWPRWVKNGGPADLEVFPKQDRVDEDRFGNLVKVPLGVHARTGERSEIVGCQGWATQLDTVRGLDAEAIPAHSESSGVPDPRTPLTQDAPTGILLSEGLVARFLQSDVQQGQRNHAFHAFFTWCAWNVHLPQDLAWSWWERLNEALDEPEDNEAEVQRTLESAYARPPADAANPRPTRGSSDRAGYHGGRSLEQRIASRRAQGRST